LVTPFSIGATSQGLAILEVQSLTSDSEIVNFAASYSYYHTYSIWLTSGGVFRSNNDMLGFYILGFSGCGELAFIENSLLKTSDIPSRILSFPGENHECLEVLVNEEWMVSDPGYTNLWLNTTLERGQSRIAEDNIGGASFIYSTDANGSRIWRTEYYVPVDTIVLRITNSSIPCSYGQVTLNHNFQGEIFTVDGISLDNNGTVIFKMGNMQNYTHANSEKWYWIYINGILTNHNITSNGTGVTRFYEFDLSE
jgi:hypothetical protein